MKKSYIVIILLVIMNVISIGYIIYDKVLISDDINNNENNTINNESEDRTNNNYNKEYQDYEEIETWGNKEYKVKYTFTENSNYRSIVEASDTYAFIIQPEYGINLYTLHNGYLYYYENECNGDEHAYCFYNSEFYMKNNNDDFIKNTKINNIKRIKTFPAGSDVGNYALMLITEDGKVYNLNEEYIEFEQFEVDDIISYTANQVPSIPPQFEIILKDGTKVKKEVIYNENTES